MAEDGGARRGRPPPSAATGLVCLLGHPVAHSASPALHAAALEMTGIDAVYLAFDVVPERFGTAIAGLRTLGGWRGANVTVPHKHAAVEIAERRTAEARLVGAANMLVRDGSALVADNTDAVGLGEVLDDLGLTLGSAAGGGAARGELAVLLGAGGAARAAAVALGRRAMRVRVDARRPAQAAEVAAVARAAGALAADVARHPTSLPRDVRIVVNATPVGLHGEALDARYHELGPGQVALDLTYGARPSPFVLAAAAAGAAALDGRRMLIAQAALAFERWWGVAAPRDAMAAAIAAP